jgi:hypothetical protein
MTTFWGFVTAHYLAIGVVAWFIFTSGVNALPPAGQPFVAGAWFMAFLRELAQQAPSKFHLLTAPEKVAVAQVQAREVAGGN